MMTKGTREEALFRSRFPALTPSRGQPSGLFPLGPGIHNKPLVARRSITILPRMESFEPRRMRFVEAFAIAMLEAFPPKFDADTGRPWTASTSDPMRLCTLPGYEAGPMTYLPKDNSVLRESLGLRPMTSLEESIFEALGEILTEEWDLSHLNINKLSSVGFRSFTRSAEWKELFAAFVLSDPEAIRQLWIARDLIGLCDRFEMVLCFYVGKRPMVDGVGKERFANDYGYAVSGGRKGSRIKVDKQVLINGKVWDNWSAARLRLINQGNFATNIFLSVITTGMLNTMMRRWPAVFHVTTREQIKAVIDGHYIWCSDVKEYDQSIDTEMIRCLRTGMKSHWAPWLMDLMDRYTCSPYFTRPVGHSAGKGHFFGNAFDPQPQVFAGNRSGDQATTVYAKSVKVGETLCVISRMSEYKDRLADGSCSVKQFVRDGLDGKLSVKFINNGDDELIYSADKAAFLGFMKCRSDKGSKQLLSVSTEMGRGFSGSSICDDPSGVPLTYAVYSQLMTPFTKIHAPERDISLRPFWPVGLTEQLTGASQDNPFIEHAWEIHNALYTKLMAQDYPSLAVYAERGMETLPETPDKYHLYELTSYDRTVLSDVSKLHYSHPIEGMSDLGRFFLKKVVKGVNAEQTLPFAKMFYTGAIIRTEKLDLFIN